MRGNDIFSFLESGRKVQCLQVVIQRVLCHGEEIVAVYTEFWGKEKENQAELSLILSARKEGGGRLPYLKQRKD